MGFGATPITTVLLRGVIPHPLIQSQMVIPNKRLIIVNETLKKKTYPFGNCGYIETSSNAMKVSEMAAGPKKHRF